MVQYMANIHVLSYPAYLNMNVSNGIGFVLSGAVCVAYLKNATQTIRPYVHFIINRYCGLVLRHFSDRSHITSNNQLVTILTEGHVQ